MKYKILMFLIGVCLLCAPPPLSANDEVRDKARQSSVHLVFHHPVFHVYFTTPLPEKKQIDADFVRKEIQSAIEKAEARRTEPKHNRYLTDINQWIEPVAKTFIPLGAVAPKGAKFPKNVLVAYETKEDEIDPYLDKYKDDVRSISEVANVSLPKAKEILMRIKAHGYSISKNIVNTSSNVKLLWFKSWDDAYPTILDWGVYLEGEPDNNLITGYDPRGIIEIKPVPDNRKVNIVAGYFDLKDEYKEKPAKVGKLERKIESLETKLKELDKDKDKPKRDIRNATFADVFYGTVKLDLFWMMGHGTGTFLGNFPFMEDSKSRGFPGLREWGYYRDSKYSGVKGVVLTNAHIASDALKGALYVSKDFEQMWFVFPGRPYVRYTSVSDHFGTPASVLQVDGEPVLSWDFDCAIMTTTPVTGMKYMGAPLGNSDDIRAGDRILMVGNPSLFQKYSTQGIISITDFSFLDSVYAGVYLKLLKNKVAYNWLKNTNLWFDATAGYGGTSGSAVWALDGKQEGKVVALHNAGVGREVLFSPIPGEPHTLKDKDGEGKILDQKDFILSVIEEEYPLETAKYTIRQNEIPEFSIVYDAMHVESPGLNGAIPINLVVQYLRERGLDFGRPLGRGYFTK